MRTRARSHDAPRDAEVAKQQLSKRAGRVGFSCCTRQVPLVAVPQYTPHVPASKGPGSAQPVTSRAAPHGARKWHKAAWRQRTCSCGHGTLRSRSHTECQTCRTAEHHWSPRYHLAPRHGRDRCPMSSGGGVTVKCHVQQPSVRVCTDKAAAAHLGLSASLWCDQTTRHVGLSHSGV